YLPIIESGFMERAVSPAQAVGIWQFIEETGRRYNLHRNGWSDKRLDPFHSARAAARLLKHLHQTFDNWELALAAYNAGAGTINWAMRVNRKAGLPTHFWALDLPEETENYVPTFLATVMIAKNPEAFG
ncbi:MAG: lytic transglycosylase domain-containing protein, partial [Gammaproteobacteria bacterium]|nr:lytic transglycosylase domain-containing protein [Gammaproteobacteria bacterium]